MYYHVIVETTDTNKKGNYERFYELNNTNLDEISELIIQPYVKNDSIYIDGRYIEHKRIRALKIKSSVKTLGELRAIAQSSVAPNVLYIYTQIMVLDSDKYVTDITKDVLKSAGGILKASTPKADSFRPKNSKVFIVHGRDELAKTEVARFVEKLGLTAIVLHEQASSGKTIIEKIEEQTDVGFAIVLYTPCDIGGLVDDTNQKHRARQNVVFEHGYLNAKLSRSNVCALVKGDIEIPNDISGVVYVTLDTHGAWHVALAKELRQAGYSIDMNKVF
jgi:predicted nucleotide-binding protein